MTLTAAMLTIGLGARAAAAQPAVAQTREGRLEQWLVAVAQHRPGEVDEPLLAFGAWTERHWQDLIVDSQVFSRGAVAPQDFGWVVGVGGGRIHIPSRYYNERTRQRVFTLVCAFASTVDLRCNGRPPREGEIGALAARATAERERGDPHYVLRRAALLHTDLIDWGGTRDTTSTIVETTKTRFWHDYSDGLGGNIHSGGGQWQIAYGLLDAILSHEVSIGRRERDAWVRDWYVATAAWMQDEGAYDEAHVEHALRYFPDDPDLHFLKATQHEIDAGKVLQLSVRTLSLPYGAQSRIAPAKDELRDARRALLVVVGARPAWGEARLRLGRVLAQLSETGEAAKELQRALDTATEPLIEYFAALFLAQAESDLGHPDRAQLLYQRASARYPDAQSPYLGLSQLERQQGNREAALSAMARVFALDDIANDPWWDYLRVQARHTSVRLSALRAPIVEHDTR